MKGSCTGAAEQLHGWTGRRKCSLPQIWTAWSTASAVPGALVPATSSAQRAPSTKCMPAAWLRSRESPSTHSIRPPASVTATIIWSASASSTSRRRITGMTGASGWAAR